MALYGKSINSYVPPANKPAHTDQIVNSDGGYVFALPELKMLERILIIGATSNYYAPDVEANAVDLVGKTKSIFDAHFEAAMALLVDVNTSTETRNVRAPKKAPSIMALAVAASLANTPERRALVKEAFLGRKVVSTLRQLHEFLYVYSAVRDEGKLKLPKWLRLALGAWLNGMSHPAQQVVKYRRSTFPGQVITNKDLLRLAHVRPATQDHDVAFAYVMGKSWEREGRAAAYLREFEALQAATNPKRVADLVASGEHTWEEVPNQWFAHVDAHIIWRALIPHMGLSALLRNMRRFAKLGLLDMTRDSMFPTIYQRLSPEALLKERVHPFNVFKAYTALKTTDAAPSAVSGLYRAMIDAYGVLPKIQQNVLLALDCSASMTTYFPVPGGSCFDVGVFIASVFANQFTGNVVAYTYANQAQPWAIRPGMEPNQMAELVQTIPGSTNPSAVLKDALDRKLSADLVVFITDNEVNDGKNIWSAAEKYRKANPKAKFVTFGLVANNFSMFGENDWSLNIAGVDAGAFQVVEAFATT